MYVSIHQAVRMAEVLREAGERSLGESIMSAARAADAAYGQRATLSLDTSAAAGYAVKIRDRNCACLTHGSASCPIHFGGVIA